MIPIESLERLGLFGIFLTSLLGHFTIVLKDVIFLPFFLYMSQFCNPLICGFLGGVGGGIGECSSYLLGRGIGEIMQDEDEVALSSWIKKLGLVGVLISSLTPLPDAPVLMLLGSADFPISSIIILEIIGKTILYSILAVTGSTLFFHISSVLPVPWDSVLILLTSLSFSVIVTHKKTRKPLFKLLQKAIMEMKKLSAYLRRL